MSDRFGLHPAAVGTEAIATYTRHLGELAANRLDLVVPTCDPWTVADLVWHLSEVQFFWSWIIENRPAPATEAELPERASATELVDQLSMANARLCSALEAASPDEETWTWHPDRRNVAFSLRRQTHEALIHCFDAVAATGGPPPEVSPRLGADGFDELVTVIAGGVPDWAAYAPSPERLLVEATDTGDQWLLEFGSITGRSSSGTDYTDEPTIRLVDNAASKQSGATVLSGAARDIDLWAWGRGPVAALAVAGDQAPVDSLRALVVESSQ